MKAFLGVFRPGFVGSLIVLSRDITAIVVIWCVSIFFAGPGIKWFSPDLDLASRAAELARNGAKRRFAMSEIDQRDGINRRKVLECMTWCVTGVLWTIAGGVPHSLEQRLAIIESPLQS